MRNYMLLAIGNMVEDAADTCDLLASPGMQRAMSILKTSRDQWASVDPGHPSQGTNWATKRESDTVVGAVVEEIYTEGV